MDDGDKNSHFINGQQHPVEGTTSSPSYQPHKLLLPIVIIIVIIVAGFSVILVKHYRSAADVCTNSANSYKLTQAAKAIAANNLTEQQKLADSIKNLSNYQKDPNCLYVVTVYYINNGDVSNANLYLRDLKSVYNPKVGFSRNLGNTESISELEQGIAVLQSNIQSDQANSYLIGPSGVHKQ